jgi:hypothetical protein
MIDELERVTQFRASQPPASELARQTAHARLMERIAEATQEAQRADHPLRHRCGRRWRYSRVTIAALGVGVVAALAVVVAIGSTAPSLAAAAALRRLAAVAALQSPVEPPQPGQYMYVDSVQANEVIDGGSDCVALVPERRQLWVGANGAGRLLETSGQASFLTAKARSACQRTHSPSLHSSGTSDLWFAPGCFSLGLGSRVHGNFENPTTLLEEMRQIDGGPPGPAEDFVHIGDFLRESDDSPALRAAIYRAAATIPGVRLITSTTDRLGRRGEAVSYTSHSSTSELILDPRTSALLGEQTVDTQTGQLTGWAAYRPTRILNHVAGHPPAPLTPPCQTGGAGYGHVIRGVTVMNGAPVKSAHSSTQRSEPQPVQQK